MDLLPLIISRHSDAWGPWGSWSSCSHSCGGDKSRSRQCIKGDCPSGNSGCVGASSETETCDHANKGRQRNIDMIFIIMPVSCRHLDYCVQPGRDVYTCYQENIPTTRHPRQPQSLAHSDRQHPLWRSLPRDLNNLSGAPTERSWLEELLHNSQEGQTCSLRLGLS